MNYEKAYKEALERAKECHIDGLSLYQPVKDVIEHIFPELAESEDEKIRKWIRKELESKYVVDNIVNNRIADKAFAWLEKQGEQKPSWDEIDEKTLNNIIEEIEPFGECPDYPTDEDREYYYGRTKMIDWLKSLKDRIKEE